MGNKTHPKAMRLGYTADWDSKWFSLREMPALIGEDFKIRNLVKNTFRMAAVSWVGIERAGSYLRVNIHTARPGVVIGKRGADIEAIRAKVEGLTQRKTFINVMEIKDPELDPRLVAEAIAVQLEKRIAYRRAMRRAMERTMQSGALGIKVMVGGRLNGSEIARREWAREGRVPLHTYSADVDYGTAEAYTTAGTIGVKCWIFKKQHFVKSAKEFQQLAKAAESAAATAAALAPAVAAVTAPVPQIPAEQTAPASEAGQGGTPHVDA
ncbi:MAG TPA: 30S ribosomal protein S3 [Elusimicrobia bacterium]|nr:30S ribosomal protein S3 [Elusimicrobiota bacterium]HBT62417.1 30S ribosomal protein S3 [Elusimicrobiota bacterium]